MRITDQHLTALCQRLNERTSSPTQYQANQTGELFRSAVGHFHIDHAYGLTRLARTMNESGGINTYGDLGTKRQTFDRIRAMLDALDLESVSTLQAASDIQKAYEVEALRAQRLGETA